MICWVCPKPESPSGGVWFIHRLARLLNETGKVASRVVQTEPFDVWWDYQPGAQSVVTDRVPMIDGHPTLVIPEVLWHTQAHYRDYPGRKIVFIQNYIWASHNRADYDGADIVTCSRFMDNWVRRKLGRKPIGMFTPYLDDGPWQVTPKTKDRTLIFARRNLEMAELLASTLHARGFGIDYVMEPLSQAQIQEKLAQAEFYVHHVAPEGIPMACMEAMRAGTIVCGTTGGGGNEFMFNQETAMVVQDPILGHYTHEPNQGRDAFALLIAREMETLRSDADLRSRIWKQAYNWIGNRYTKQRTIDQLAQVFG